MMLAEQSVAPVVSEPPFRLRIAVERPDLPAGLEPSSHSASPPVGAGGSPRLSPREGEVLEWLKRGLSEKEVAEELRVSPHTVHTYVKGLFRLFDVRTRAELMAWCLAGLRPPDRYRLRRWPKV